MPRFEFALRRVLDWRRTQLDLAENQLRHMAAAVEELSLSVVKLDLVKERAEQSACQAAVLEASDLWALAAYRQRLISERKQLLQRRVEAERQVAAQRQRVVEAQRQCRLLEKLEDRRRAEWQAFSERELEALATENYLALWQRGPVGLAGSR
jgi:flagellar export protein FliJ